MRVIVTGGFGFLGRRVARRLLAEGHEVLAMDVGGEPPPGAEGKLADIGDGEEVAAVFSSWRPDAVIHLAALLTPASQGDIVAATRVNALGTANVFSAALAAGTRRIVYASSVAALGDADPSPGDRTVPSPTTVYGATKAYGEHLARAVAAAHPEATFVGLRFGWVYGPGRDRGWREIQAVVEAAVRGEPRVPYPDLPEPIDWTWVDDAAEVAARAAIAPLGGSHVFNVAGDKRPIAEMIAHLRRRFTATAFEPSPAPRQPASWGFANDRVEAALGYVPSTRMEDGIDRLIESLRT